MTGFALLIAFVVAIVVMILLISKAHLHPFPAILLVSLIFGIVGGIPLADQTLADGSTIPGIATIIGQGFSGTFTSIGIVIIFGTIIGSILERTGAALRLADMVIRLVGPSRPAFAMEIMGWVVSVPVFCDSGFVILNPIRRALVKRTAKSSIQMSVCLSAGLYASHVFIPPTPGPIAAANTLGVGDHLLLIMGLGILASILPLGVAYLYGSFIGKKERAKDEADAGNDSGVVETYEDLLASYGSLPSGVLSLAPILVPVLLMSLSNLAGVLGGAGSFDVVLRFLGTPIIALAVGVVCGIFLMHRRGQRKDLYEVIQSSLQTAGPILFITAAGGVLGKIISSTPLVSFLTENAASLQTLGIFFPFLVAAVLKTAQGSSTVAITTTAGIVMPLLGVLGFDSTIGATLVVLAIGAGAMTVSHANDSYFWVVTNFGAMATDQGYRTQTLVTLMEGIAGIMGIFLLSLVLR